MLTSPDVLIVGSIILILLYLYLTKNSNHWKNRNVPYIKPLPVFGNIFNGILMRHSMGEIFYDLYYKSIQPVVGFFILDQPCLLLRDPKIIKRILITDFQYFNDRNITNNKRDDPIGTYVLFVLKNPDWREIRTQITPVFTSAKIKTMFQLIEGAAEEMTLHLKERIKTNPVVEMKEVCIKFTVDVIATTIFGVNGNSFTEENSQFSKIGQKLLDWNDFMTAFRFRCYFLAPKLVKLFRMKLLNPECIEFLKTSFLKIMDHRTASKTTRNDLIDILLEIKKKENHFLEGDILVAQAVMFFAAGFETSSSAIAFGLYEIAHHPEIQEKLRNEIKIISEKRSCLDYESISEMNYLDMCVKEILRKYPVVPFLERKCNTRYIIPENGTPIDKDIPVFISTLALHYDPDYFPEPEQFDPQRFSKENKIENSAYLPFGDGPRNCIGARFGLLNTKLGLAYILKNFKIESCSQTPKKIKFNPKGIVLSSLDGIKLQLSKI